MTCGAHTASQPWRRHQRARDTCPATPDIDRATSRAPRALSCTYTFDPVQWVGTCKRNRPEPTKHAPAMPMARVPVSLHTGQGIQTSTKHARCLWVTDVRIQSRMNTPRQTHRHAAPPLQNSRRMPLRPSTPSRPRHTSRLAVLQPHPPTAQALPQRTGHHSRQPRVRRSRLRLSCLASVFAASHSLAWYRVPCRADRSGRAALSMRAPSRPSLDGGARSSPRVAKRRPARRWPPTRRRSG